MGYDAVTKHLLSLPGAKLSIQWGDEHVFKVGGKMFAAMRPKKTKPHGIWFKADEMSFHVLTKVKGITPSPYLARAHWVSVDRLGRLSDKELRAYLTRAHALVAAGLTRKMRMALGIAEPPHAL
jgi:predicted DNA-binding protein (MmcQ/YjbR family)